MRNLLIILSFLVSLISCANKRTSPALFSDEMSQVTGNSTIILADQIDVSDRNRSDRLISSTALIKIETSNPDSVHDHLIIIASELKGYVASSGGGLTSIKVPAENLKSAISQIELLGNVLEKHVAGKDVTEEFQDLEIRIENAEKSRQRYLELLNKATTVSEVLLVEKELERLNTTIELLKGSRERLSNSITFSSISVRTVDKVKLGPLGRVFVTLYDGVKWLFIW